MAVNIPLVEAAGVSGASRLPQSYPGEMIVLERSGVECEMVDAVSKWKSVKGVMFLTSLRLVFVVDVKELAKSRYESVEFPLQGVWDEELKQPIFGCNHIKFTSQFVRLYPQHVFFSTQRPLSARHTHLSIPVVSYHIESNPQP